MVTTIQSHKHWTNEGVHVMAKCGEAKGLDVAWKLDMRPRKLHALDKDSPMDALLVQIEHVQDRIRAKMEQPFGGI